MQIIANGAISGLAIALLAVAFQLVYLPTRVFFIGLACLYSLAPYIYLAGWRGDVSPIGCVLAALAMVVALALVFELVNHAPLARKGASEGAQLISSLGLYILVVQVVAMVWGNDTQTLRTGLDATVRFSDVVLTESQLLMVGAGSTLLICFLAMLRVTDTGLRLRALADNPIQFALYGYNINAYRLIAFGLAGLFATGASLLTSYDIGFTPYSGLHAVVLAVVAVIVGGRTSFSGPIIGGVLLGLVRAQVVWYFSARWQEVVTFLVLALFLLIRPQGLFGQKTRIEASN